MKLMLLPVPTTVSPIFTPVADTKLNFLLLLSQLTCATPSGRFKSRGNVTVDVNLPNASLQLSTIFFAIAWSSSSPLPLMTFFKSVMRRRTEFADPAVALVKLSYRSFKAFLSFTVPMLDVPTLAHSSSDPSVVVILVCATVFKASKILEPCVEKSSVS